MQIIGLSPEQIRYNALTPDQRETARILAESTPIGFWDAVAYLTDAKWDMIGAGTAIMLDVLCGRLPIQARIAAIDRGGD